MTTRRETEKSQKDLITEISRINNYNKNYTEPSSMNIPILLLLHISFS